MTNSDLDSYHDDEEIIETSHFVTQDHNQHIVASYLLEDEGILHLDSQEESYKMSQQYEENLYTPLFEINEDNHCLSNRKQKVLSPLFEDEIDQLLKGHVTAQANVDL